MGWRIKKTALLAMLLALSLVLFVLEAQIPMPVFLPGAKPGFANIVTLVCLFFLSRREAFFVLFLRIVLSCVLSAGFAGFLYSVSGGLCSFFIMAAAMGRRRPGKLWLVSILGGIFHNIGQLLAAAFVLKSGAVFAYFPFLILCGTVTGLVNGTAAGWIVQNRHIRDLFKGLERV